MSIPLGPVYIIGDSKADVLGLLAIFPLNINDLQIIFISDRNSSKVPSKTPLNLTTTFTNGSVTMALTYSGSASYGLDKITSGTLNINNDVETSIEQGGIVRNVGWKWLSNIFSWDVSGELSGKASIAVVESNIGYTNFDLSKVNKVRMYMDVSSSTKVSSPINGSFTIASKLTRKSYVIEVQNSLVTKGNLWDTFSFTGTSISKGTAVDSRGINLDTDYRSGTVPLLDIIEISEFNESHK